jgi:hypothetical protein
VTGYERSLLRDVVVRARLGVAPGECALRLGEIFECRHCSRWLPADEFRQLAKRRDSWCMVCRAEDARRYRLERKQKAPA